jgi:hypothetical protein
MGWGGFGLSNNDRLKQRDAYDHIPLVTAQSLFSSRSILGTCGSLLCPQPFRLTSIQIRRSSHGVTSPFRRPSGLSLRYLPMAWSDPHLKVLLLAATAPKIMLSRTGGGRPSDGEICLVSSSLAPRMSAPTSNGDVDFSAGRISLFLPSLRRGCGLNQVGV